MAKSDSAGSGEALPPDIVKLSFEDALSELQEVVQRLESGDVNLEDSIEIYTRGTQLKHHCEAKLRAAQERVEKIVAKADGSIGTEPVETE